MIRRRATRLLLVVLGTLPACDRPASDRGADTGAVLANRDVRAETLRARGPGLGSIGRAASRAEIEAWNIDVNASGVGLPQGRGTYADGAVVFARQCVVCHGQRGEGIGANPRLVATMPRDFSFGRDAKLVKTIGNYWPYATTLYDYINRAMPFTAPGSLSPDEVYSVVAYLLAENGIIDRRQVMDARSLPRVRMPARGHFVMDNRTGGSVFR